MTGILAIPHVHQPPKSKDVVLELQISSNLPWFSIIPENIQEVFFLELASQMLKNCHGDAGSNLSKFLGQFQKLVADAESRRLSPNEIPKLQMEIGAQVPWMEYLPQAEQRIFFLEAAAELIDMVKNGREFEIRQFLTKWESRAAEFAYADPMPETEEWDHLSDEALARYESESPSS